MHLPFILVIIYIKLKTNDCTTPRKRNANIGERSKPLIGGISLLKGSKIGSVMSFNSLNG